MEERKIKTGGQEKVEVAEASLKSFASSRQSFLEKESPKLSQSSGFQEALRYNTNLMQKIQLKESWLKEARVLEADEVD